MRLFWKLFCSMVIITALVCSLGGYFLIDQQFRASLDREVSALYEENDLLRYTLARELALQPIDGEAALSQLVSSISITTGRGAVAFRISDETGRSAAVKGSIPVDAAPLTAQLGEGQRGWEVVRVEERVFLHAASPLSLSVGTLYLENRREVTSLFSARQEQYQNFFYLMLALTAIVGALSLAVASVILRPLARLSAATKRMAAGELDQRVRVDSSDELGRLSEDFNAMAARLEEQVQELKDAARAAGHQPLICSSYRTWGKQAQLFEAKTQFYLDQGYAESEAEVQAAAWVARPGTSEHQAGLAVDIVDTAYQLLDKAQEGRPVQQWLMAHCAEYGFILRYPTGKSDLTGVNYEPWHYRYVGQKAAREIMDQGLCLEEYLAA